MLKDNKDIKILIVEDEYLVKEMIKGVLFDLGYTNLHLGSNGVEAIEKASSLKPDLILMDLKMPEMGGIEATKIIQKKNPIPIIILTAYETTTLLEEATEAGASAYLVKPVNITLLERAILIALARHKDLMEVKELNNLLMKKNFELEKAIEEIELLQRILPICSKCKSIRDDKGYWTQVEDYMANHSEIKFTHSICENCSDDLYGKEPWYDEYKKKRELRIKNEFGE